ncbi:hypothetical protein [Thermoplasma sp.]|uniref:hypothetical protein n=1 Tax=Thermoplasma sp. TaxID=1973142 RepID=UPI00126B096F|nr:hypothetical protein [Thermoplasma sp.]KAA8923480.1 MAG: hypothetical protein F6Q11_00565 [Thermoplasma sp.]
MDRHKVIEFLEKNAHLFDVQDAREFIDQYFGVSFFKDILDIDTDGEYSFISDVTGIIGERSIDREDRVIRYRKFWVGNRIIFTLWNDEIEKYAGLIAVSAKLKFIFCRIQITRFGIEGSLGLRGFIERY